MPVCTQLSIYDCLNNLSSIYIYIYICVCIYNFLNFLAALCFLILHTRDAAKMTIVILCRTQGRNLSDFMFREKSNVAIRILDNIAVEAAGLAYKELRFCSEKLRKEKLWMSFSSSSVVLKQPTPLLESMDEMLRLSHVRPLSVSQSSGNNLTDGLPELTMLLGDESGINWPVCCNCMKRDKRVFSPHWSFEGPPLPPPLHDDIQQKQQHDPKTVTHLFYMRDEDLFLLLKISSSPSSVLPSTNTAASTTNITSTATGNLLAASIVEKNEVANLERRRMALQKFANFLLHYIWQNL